MRVLDRNLCCTLAVFVLAVVIGLTVAADDVEAHASLIQARPSDGERLQRAPREVTFRFSERIEGAVGAVRVFDGRGARIDDEVIRRLGRRGDTVGVGLRPGLPDGMYTATYRIVSADSHVLTGGAVFRIGDGNGSGTAIVGAGGDEASIPLAKVAFVAVRVLAYAAMLIGIGGVVFLLAAWMPAVRRQADATDVWREASLAFAGRLRRLLALGVVLGLSTSVVGLACQAALVEGTTLWAAFDPGSLGSMLETRFGLAWGARGVAWTILGLIVFTPRPMLRPHLIRPATLGADGLGIARPLTPFALGCVALVMLVIALSVGLSGHAAAGAASWASLPASSLHVLAMSAWVGALVALLYAVPSAARCVPPDAARRLLAAVVRGVSRISLCAVVVVLTTGIVQSLLRLNEPGDLVSSPYGNAVLAKVALMIALLAFGAYNQRRVLPRLATLSSERDLTQAQALWLSIGGELALFAVVLGVTATLAGTSPPPPAPQTASLTRDLGPVRMRLKATPLRVGAQTLMVELRDRGGAPYRRVKELELQLRLAERGIGPLPLRLERTGPGRYVATGADVGFAGDWQLEARLAISDFDVYRTTVPLRVR